MNLDWIESVVEPVNEEVAYRLDDARARYEVRELNSNAWLVIHRKDALWLRFAVLRFCQSNADGSDVLTNCLFHGEGPVGNLRECRHTYWGDDGYIFYVDGPVITAAFKVLAEFFDDMV